MENKYSSGFLDALTLIFITLKLIGEITWSWWWVLSPLWLPLVIVVAVGIIAAIFVVIYCLWEQYR